MKRKYNEIFKLKDMLEKAKIPFKFNNHAGGYQLSYSDFKEKIVCFVIEHDYSHGREEDLLEIKGLLTEL